MLLLTRKIGESSYIDEIVIVRLLEIKGHQVLLGIDAPREVKICREELYRKTHQEDIS